MTPTQIDLIRTSWSAVEPISEAAATLFYQRLFELDADIERLFRRADMAKQRAILMGTLAVVVRSLDRLDTIVPAIEALGRRHAGYGVRPEHYDTVGAALLWTLDKGLGQAFDSDTREAWSVAYGTLAGLMIEAGSKVDQAAA